MELKHEKKNIYSVDYSDLDRFITEVYGHEYEFVADEETSNYMSKEYNDIDGDISEREDSEWDKKSWDKWINTGKCSFFARDILQDLCHKGLIEPGNYVINVYW